MLLSGFTFVRNAVKFDYPVLESIHSILPIVDEFVVNVGPDQDGTLDLIKSIKDKKIKIIQSEWNPNLKNGGYVYAQQTNIALFNCLGKWAFYLQADEVVHEKDLSLIQEKVFRLSDDERVEGLTLDELSFWGDYNTIINVYPWRYSKRCWIVKPHRFVLSRGDASGFCVHPKYKERGRRIRVVNTGARVFHYSNVKSLKALREKNKAVQDYWTSSLPPGFGENLATSHYNSGFPRHFVDCYNGDHPIVMSERIKKHPFSIDLDSNQWNRRLSFKDRRRLFQTWYVKIFGDRFGCRRTYDLISDNVLKH